MNPIEDEAVAAATTALRMQWTTRMERLDQTAQMVIDLRKAWDTLTTAFTTLWQEMDGLVLLSGEESKAPIDIDDGQIMRISLAAQLLGVATFWQPEDFDQAGEEA